MLLYEKDTVELFKIVVANFRGLLCFFAYPWGCNFVDVLFFQF